jgi:type II restriction enzyme
MLNSRANYLAIGELKGGIDPAGADEHWKTAMSALERVREVFDAGTIPKLFFIGTAIEDHMAGEIFRELSTGNLSAAANLTSDEQTSDLIDWLVSL